MGTIASQITSLTIVYPSAYSDANERKHQGSALLAICAGNSPVPGEFPAQMASNTENVSIWWRHHEVWVIVLSWHVLKFRAIWGFFYWYNRNLIADIKNNAWVTVNDDFWVTSEAICQWFSRRHEWKSLANRLTSDPKIVIQGNECIILFLTRYFMSWTHNSAKNNYRSLISPLSLRTALSALVLWRHHSWSQTSHERTALALWRHIRRLLLHAQIGAKAIFTSE